MKKFITGTLALGAIVATTSGIFASENFIQTPAEIYAKIKGVTVEEAYEQKGDKTFGQLAQEDGKFEVFQSENLEAKKAILEQRVQDGTITEEQKEDILEQMQDCNGERQGIGRQFGLKMGQRNGNGGCQGRFGTNQ